MPATPGRQALASARRMRRPSPVVAVMSPWCQGGAERPQMQELRVPLTQQVVVNRSVQLRPLFTKSPLQPVGSNVVMYDSNLKLHSAKDAPFPSKSFGMWPSACLKLSRAWPWCRADELPCASTASEQVLHLSVCGLELPLSKLQRAQFPDDLGDLVGGGLGYRPHSRAPHSSRTIVAV